MVQRWFFLRLCMFVVFSVSVVRPVEAQGVAPGDRVVVGEWEPVRLGVRGEEKKVDALAKVDTGATYSSMGYDLARDLGIDLDEQEIITVQSSLGEDKRRLVDVRLEIAGKILDTKITVSDREEFDNKMLLGNRDLESFLVDTSREQITTPEAPEVASPVAALPQFPPPPPAAPTLLATLPLAAVLIVALRTFVGVSTFGLFAPVLLALAFVQTGVPVGLALFGTMTATGLIVQPLLGLLRLPRVARLAVLLAVAAATILATNELVDNPAVSATWAAAFPVVVTATIIERFWDVWEQEDLRQALTTAWWTLLTALVASAAGRGARALGGGFGAAPDGARGGRALDPRRAVQGPQVDRIQAFPSGGAEKGDVMSISKTKAGRTGPSKAWRLGKKSGWGQCSG